MRLLFFCTRWGQEHLSWNDFCKNVKNSGYDGVETSLPADDAEVQLILAALKQHDLKWIGQHWDTVTPDFDRHIKEYDERLRAMASAMPGFITSHTGKDHFTFEQNAQLIALAQKISLETGMHIIHETHRGKFSFAAHITKAYLEKIPDLKLTLDISHWYAVAESYLADQQEAVDAALVHTDHVHVRIGHTQGPQVSDPRSPEWADALQNHLVCWDKVVKIQKDKGAEQFTFTCEFGPLPYMQLQPFTNTPVADQWEINAYMKDLLKNRYKNEG